MAVPEHPPAAEPPEPAEVPNDDNPQQPTAGLGPDEAKNDNARVEAPTEEQRKELAAKGIFYDETNGCYIKTGGEPIKNPDGSYKTAQQIIGEFPENQPKLNPADAPAGPAPGA